MAGNVDTLVQTAINVASKTYDAVSDPSYQATSLTQHAKKCFIESRAYIDKDIEHEKVTQGILKFALTMQGALVIAALRLDGLVTAGVSVSDRLRRVATESNANYIDTAALLRQDAIALESVSVDIDHENKKLDIKFGKDEKESVDHHKRAEEARVMADSARREAEDLHHQAAEAKEEARRLKHDGDTDGAERATRRAHDLELDAKECENTAKEQTRISATETRAAENVDRDLDEVRKQKDRISTIKAEDVTPDTNVNLTVGKIINVTLSNSEGDSSATVPLFVRINPYMVAPELVSYMMETAGPTKYSGVRKAQLKAGEISFWRDYVFGMDLIHKQEKTLRKDHNGEFAEYIRQSVAKDRGRVIDTFRKVMSNGYRTSSNLANSVLVFSQDAIKDGEMRGGIKLDKFTDRQRFFTKSYAAMIFVIDPNHERVTMYLNGFKDVGHYSYSDFIHKKDLEGEDFMSVLRTISQGQISRF